MSSKWTYFKLIDICTKIGSGATPTGGKSTYTDFGEYALIRSQNVLDFVFSHNGLAYINKKQATKLNNVAIKKDDVLINITGDSVARVCMVPVNVLPARVNQHVSILRADPELFSSLLLKYLMLSQDAKDKLLSLASSGATRNALTKTMLENFEVYAPEDIKEQVAIARKLQSLDDKIANNNRINKSLEEIAQALFKSWFVDFEPVKAKIQAKAEGKDPQIAAMCAISGKTAKETQGFASPKYDELRATADLFPDNLVESETDSYPKGLIPEGWGVKSIKFIADHIKKNITPSKNGNILYSHYSLPAFDSGRKPKLECGADIKSNKYKVGSYSILISKLNPNTPRIWDIISPFDENSICSTEFQVVKPKQKYAFEFVSLTLKSQRVVNELAGKVTGTSKSHQRIKPDDIFNTKIALPPKDLLKAFSLQTNNSFKLIDLNIKQNVKLSESRDTLLPKLLSGVVNMN